MVYAWTGGDSGFRAIERRRRRGSWRRSRLTRAIGAEPDIALVIDRDSMVRAWPVMPFRFAPMPHQVPCRVEFKHVRRLDAALGAIGSQIGLFWLQGAFAVNNPYVVTRIHRNADGLANHPVVRQRLRPERIDFEFWGHHPAGVNYGASADQHRSGPEKRRQSHDCPAYQPFSTHSHSPRARTYGADSPSPITVCACLYSIGIRM